MKLFFLCAIFVQGALGAPQFGPVGPEQLQMILAAQQEQQIQQNQVQPQDVQQNNLIQAQVQEALLQQLVERIRLQELWQRQQQFMQQQLIEQQLMRLRWNEWEQAQRSPQLQEQSGYFGMRIRGPGRLHAKFNKWHQRPGQHLQGGEQEPRPYSPQSEPQLPVQNSNLGSDLLERQDESNQYRPDHQSQGRELGRRPHKPHHTHRPKESIKPEHTETPTVQNEVPDKPEEVESTAQAPSTSASDATSESTATIESEHEVESTTAEPSLEKDVEAESKEDEEVQEDAEE